jgi:hypothetical protein
MKTRLRRYVGPLSLVGLAVLLNVGIALRPNPEIDLGPIDLKPGATARAIFQAGYAETYAIGVRMDQRVAERLYPCTVSPQAMQKPECKSPASPWPLTLALKLSSGGRDLTGEIERSASLAGGEYEGANAYTWEAAYIRPVPGRTYNLEVRSTGRASSLDLAQPRLVVSAVGAPGLLEGMAIQQVVADIVGVLLIAGAAIWTFAISRRRQTAG